MGNILLLRPTVNFSQVKPLRSEELNVILSWPDPQTPVKVLIQRLKLCRRTNTTEVVHSAVCFLNQAFEELCQMIVKDHGMKLKTILPTLSTGEYLNSLIFFLNQKPVIEGSIPNTC